MKIIDFPGQLLPKAKGVQVAPHCTIVGVTQNASLAQAVLTSLSRSG